MFAYNVNFFWKNNNSNHNITCFLGDDLKSGKRQICDQLRLKLGQTHCVGSDFKGFDHPMYQTWQQKWRYEKILLFHFCPAILSAENNNIHLPRSYPIQLGDMVFERIAEDLEKEPACLYRHAAAAEGKQLTGWYFADKPGSQIAFYWAPQVLTGTPPCSGFGWISMDTFPVI